MDSHFVAVFVVVILVLVVAVTFRTELGAALTLLVNNVATSIEGLWTTTPVTP